MGWRTVYLILIINLKTIDSYQKFVSRESCLNSVNNAGVNEQQGDGGVLFRELLKILSGSSTQQSILGTGSENKG